MAQPRVVPLHGEPQRRGLARPVRQHARVQRGVLPLEVRRLEPRERDADLEVELLPGVHRQGFASVRRAQTRHGVLDAPLGHRAELGAVDARARPRHGARARVHHLEAYVLALAVAVEPEDEVRAPAGLALEVLHDPRPGARLELRHRRGEQGAGVHVPALEPGREVDRQDVAEDRGDAEVARGAAEAARELVHLRAAPAARAVGAVGEEGGDGRRERGLLRDAQHRGGHGGRSSGRGRRREARDEPGPRPARRGPPQDRAPSDGPPRSRLLFSRAGRWSAQRHRLARSTRGCYSAREPRSVPRRFLPRACSRRSPDHAAPARDARSARAHVAFAREPTRSPLAPRPRARRRARTLRSIAPRAADRFARDRIEP